METNKQTNTEENNQSRKDIANKWIDEIIYNHLTNLNFLERLTKDGCRSIIEYVNIPKNQLQSLPNIQIKNLDLLIHEFEMTFEDAKEIIKKTELDNMKKELKKIKEVKLNGFNSEPYYKIITKIKTKYRITRETKTKLTTTFYVLVKKLSELRGNLITSLKHILWINEKGEFKIKKKGEY